MTDLELLYAVLALIYCWECAWWLRRGAVGFRTWRGRRWGVVHPSVLLGNQALGFVFGCPLPPLGTILAGAQTPLSLAPDGVLAFVAPVVNPGWRPPQSARLVRWEEFRSVEAKGKTVRVNGTILVKALSPTFAGHLADGLRRLSREPAARREKAIREWLQAGFDQRALKARWQEFERETGRLKLLANGLFAFLFIAAPGLIWFLGLHRCWLGLVAGLLGFLFGIAFLFRRAHKKLYPSAEDERFTQFIIVLLSPATTPRARDLLSRPLLESFHPLTIAEAFCPKESFLALARLVVREIRYPALPACPLDDPLARGIEGYWRSALRETVERFLKQSGVEAAELLLPPAATDPACRSYCPRCLTQFTTAGGECADCGGIRLEALVASTGGK